MAFISLHSISADTSNNSLKIMNVNGLNIERFFYFIQRQGSSDPLADLFRQYALHYNLK